MMMAPSPVVNSIHDLVGEHARKLSERLQTHRLQLFPPSAQKSLRKFSSGEAAKWIGTDDGHLRRLSLEGKGPAVETGPNGRRAYSTQDLQALRTYSGRQQQKRAQISSVAQGGREAAGHHRCQFQGRQRQDDDGRASGPISGVEGLSGSGDRSRPASEPFRPARRFSRSSTSARTRRSMAPSDLTRTGGR